MKWVTKDYRGDTKVWYSEDVIRKIELICQSANCLGKQYLSTQILKLLKEVDK